jgi:rhodanese-related sulfurtransferase
MNNMRAAVAVPLFLLVASVLLSAAAVAAEPVRITKEELRKRMGHPGIVVVDVRLGGGGFQSDRKIAGSVREDPLGVDVWAPRYPKDTPIVLYCS